MYISWKYIENQQKCMFSCNKTELILKNIFPIMNIDNITVYNLRYNTKYERNTMNETSKCHTLNYKCSYLLRYIHSGL